MGKVVAKVAVIAGALIPVVGTALMAAAGVSSLFLTGTLLATAPCRAVTGPLERKR